MHPLLTESIVSNQDQSIIYKIALDADWAMSNEHA